MAANSGPFGENPLIVDTVVRAGEIGMSYFGNTENKVWYKNGKSPVSMADKEIDTFLKTTLTAALPDHGWLSEETDDDDARLDCERVLIVDPIDGTRGFLEGRKEWCISLAVIENNRPVEAVLHCPPLERTFYAKLGQGVKFSALVEPKNRTPGKPLATGSKKLIETMAQLPGQPFDVAPFIPSLAYRLAMVATGELDAAFAKPGASEWDVAAADLILREAKCQLTTNDGDAIRYNQRSVTLPSLLAASNNNHDTIMSLANSSRIIH